MRLHIFILFCLYYYLSFVLSLRIGHLEATDSHEKEVIRLCSTNSTHQIITLPACDHFSGLENAARLHYTHNVDAFIGASCDQESETVSRLAYRWTKVYLSTSRRTSVEKEVTTVAFQSDSSLAVCGALHTLCTYAGWNQVSVVYSTETEALESLIVSRFSLLQNVNISIAVEQHEYHWMERIIDNSRVILIFLPFTDFLSLLIEISRHSIALEFALIFVATTRMSEAKFFDDVRTTLNDMVPSSRRSSSMIKNVYFFESTHHDWRPIEDFAFKHGITTISPSLQDALLLCDALSIIDTYSSDKKLSQKELFDDLWSHITAYRGRGYSGEIFVSPDGFRQSFFRFSGLVDDHQQIILKLEPSDFPCNDSRTCESHVAVTTAYSSSFLSVRPPSVPKCGYDGSLCGHLHIFLIALIVISILSVPLTIAYNLQRKEDELSRMPWRLSFDQISKVYDEGSLRQNRRVSSASSAWKSVFPDTTAPVKHGYLEEQKISIKTYRQKRAITFTRGEMESLNMMKNMSHANVNSFVGMSFNQNGELNIMWAYCSRQSLQHIFYARDQKFGRNFQSAFIKHVVAGLQFIHQSSIKVHGALFLSNCVVDSYWVVKLTDFGLRQILNQKLEHKEITDLNTLDVENLPIKYLELAPEHLRELLDNSELGIGSVAGDLYQLGMIIYQILFYKKPFTEKKVGVKSMAEALCDEKQHADMRPVIPEKAEFTTRLVSIMQQCWLYNTRTRSTLLKISDAVSREFGSVAKGNLIDQMIKMIDEYSANLEEIVAKRTAELETMNAKTEALLYQIMPKNIATDLLEGRAVRPQQHTSVSLLVADICQFTALCESCIPVHIIEILQQLYSSFDNIVSNYNAFKVENVGDAYLIVSGIPELEGCQHLLQICRIALKLQEFVKTFIVAHRPDHKLKIKVGINSGAVASGILGSTAPRFCLFGDSINMACRMASSGLPEKNQLTEMTAAIIAEKIPSLITEERGVVDIKGKGACTTFWLLGETDPREI